MPGPRASPRPAWPGRPAVAGLEGAVGVAHFNGADLLDALGDRLLQVDGTRHRLVVGSHKVDQANDDEHRGHEREENGQQELLGVLDGTGVVFFVRRGLAVVAHGVLKISVLSKQPVIIAAGPAKTPTIRDCFPMRL